MRRWRTRTSRRRADSGALHVAAPGTCMYRSAGVWPCAGGGPGHQEGGQILVPCMWRHLAHACTGQQECGHAQVADPDIKKAGFVTKWLGYGAQSIGPVQRKDGTTAEREIETWLPKKKVKAYSLRCLSLSPCRLGGAHMLSRTAPLVDIAIKTASYPRAESRRMYTGPSGLCDNIGYRLCQGLEYRCALCLQHWTKRIGIHDSGFPSLRISIFYVGARRWGRGQ